MLLSFVASIASSTVYAAAGDVVQDEQIAADADISTAPVTIDGHLLFRVRGVTSFPADARAAGIKRRIEDLARDPAFKPEALEIDDNGSYSSLNYGGQRVMAITDADANLEQVKRSTLAPALQDRIRRAVQSYRFERSRDYLLRVGAYSLGATGLLAVALLATLWLTRRLEVTVLHRLRGRIRSLGVQSFEIVRARHLRVALQTLLRMLRLIILLAVVLIYLSWVLNQFPWTRDAGEHLFDAIAQPLATAGLAILHFIPNLIFLVILALVVRVALRILRLFFDAVEGGNVKLTAFEPEWSLPTYKLIRLGVIAFALIIAYPYIPGSDSAAFKGVSLLAGVLLSIGSSSAIANIIAGYMITYRRAFKVGDRVQIGDTLGDVMEMRLQVTHLRTLKNEEVVIPNSYILNNHVTNYTSYAAKQGLILHTVVGIGYETPWRQVEAMLREAAARTASVLKEPHPFVLQTKLGDFAVNYELNAYCDQPHRVPEVYSELHRNVLDVFNEHSVAIMTPAYVADPEEPKFVPKARWYEAPAVKPNEEGAL